jgi:hypothetical protein
MTCYRHLANHAAASAVDAIVVGGSVGRGLAKEDSDLDLFLLVRKDGLSEFLATRMRTLAEYGGDISLFRGPVFVEGYGYSFTVLYGLNFICQFNVNTLDTLIPNHMWNPHSIVLFDKTGHYTKLLSNRPPTPDFVRLFQQAFTFFWLRSLVIAKYRRRGHIWAAIAHFNDLRNQMMVLHRLSNSAPPIGYNYTFPAKDWEDQITPASAPFLEQTLCRNDPTSVSAALDACTTWFLAASTEYATTQSLDFTAELSFAREIYLRIRSELRSAGQKAE